MSTRKPFSQSLRWDETWRRLLEWTDSAGQAERLAAQVLIAEGYKGLDPSHPLGGPDGGKDALCKKGGKKWLMATYFPRGRKQLATIKKKFLHDLRGVRANSAAAFVFVTNQELTLAARKTLKLAAKKVPLKLYHLERITAILDKPAMSTVRAQFLGIESADAWPDPAIEASSLEQLASHVEAAAFARVEILAKHGERLLVWVKPQMVPTRSNIAEVKATLLGAACVLCKVKGVRTLEVGCSDTSDAVGSVGQDGMGCWRVRFDVDDVRRIARTKHVDPTFWQRARVMLAAGDNLHVGQRSEAFADFEGRAARS